jgi:6-pyruvoyltetrahydropterin/6-carboxytetrahydropterin synthase
MTTIQKTFQIEAAHWLPNVPEDHKCRRMHGHSFQIEVHVEGPIDNASGWVMDFADVSDAFAPIFEQIDHRCLNDVTGLANPTSENLACWVWANLKPVLPALSCVVVRETCTSACIYRGT